MNFEKITIECKNWEEEENNRTKYMEWDVSHMCNSQPVRKSSLTFDLMCYVEESRNEENFCTAFGCKN